MTIDGERGRPWTGEEIEVAVDAYFEMLQLEAAEQPYVKTDFRWRCEDRLPARSGKSIEMKWSNISAVLEELGHERLEGFAPMRNYQAALRPAVQARMGL